MRLTIIALAAGFVGFGITFSMAHADAVKVSPHLTVFTKDRSVSGDGSPTILRGSAIKRGTVNDDDGRYDDLGPVQIGAGSTLWLADPATGAIIACEPLRTSRYMHCFDGDKPY